MDVIKALREIELDQVMQLDVLGSDGRRGGRVEREVEVWEKEIRGKRKGYRDRVKARESGGGVGDTTLEGDTSLIVEGDGDGKGNEDQHEKKRMRIEDDGREGSTGTIERGVTSKLKLNVGRVKDEDDVVDGNGDVGDEENEEEAESEDEDFESAEEEQEEGDTQNVEDSIDVDGDETGLRSQRKAALAPDGSALDSGDESE